MTIDKDFKSALKGLLNACDSLSGPLGRSLVSTRRHGDIYVSPIVIVVAGNVTFGDDESVNDSHAYAPTFCKRRTQQVATTDEPSETPYDPAPDTIRHNTRNRRTVMGDVHPPRM